MRLDKIKNTLQGTLWGVANKIVALIFPFIIRTILIRKLGAEYAGLSSLFTSILQVLSLTDLGISSAIVFSMYKAVSEDDKNTLSAYLNYFRKMFFFIGIITLFIGILVMPFLQYLIKGDVPLDINLYILYIIYLSNTVISYFGFAYRSSILSAYQREADNSKFQMICNLTMYIVQIIVLMVFKNYYIYIIFLPIFTLVLNLTRYIYVCKKYPDIQCTGTISILQKKQLKKNVSALFLHKIGSVTVNTLDNVIISSFLGLVTLANYNNYYYLISAVTAIILIFFTSLTAGVGNSLIMEESRKVQKDFYTIFYFNGFIVSVSTTCFFAMYQDFITLWVGKEYLFDSIMMVLFCVYYYIHTIRRTIIAYRDASGMWVDNKWQPIVSTCVNLSLNIVLIQTIGVKGVVISTIISMIFVDMPWETGKLINRLFNESTKRYMGRLLFYTIITIFNCLAIYCIFKFVLIDHIIIKLILDFILSLFVSILIFIFLTSKLEEFEYAKTLVMKIINRIK